MLGRESVKEEGRSKPPIAPVRFWRKHGRKIIYASLLYFLAKWAVNNTFIAEIDPMLFVQIGMALLMQIGQVAMYFGFFFWMLGGRIRTKLYLPGDLPYTWDDYVGNDAVRDRLKLIVDMLMVRKGLAKKLGGVHPTHTALVGPPGTGKSYAATIVAAEAQVPVLSVEASSLLGCVTGDTLVTTENGLRKISGLDPGGNGHERPFALSLHDGERVVESDCFYSPGIHPVIRVETKEGFSVAGTYNHPLLVLDSKGEMVWRRLDQIQSGDFLAINRGANLWGNSAELSLDDAYELGLYVSEGWRRRDKTGAIIITNSALEIIKFLMGRGYRATGKRGIHHKNAHSQIAQWTTRGERARQKRIPDIVLRSPRKVIIAFLQGLFDGDGHGHKKRGSVMYASSSRKLIMQLQILLLNFGIVGRIYETHSDLGNGFRLDIEGVDARRFYDEIGFRLPKKQVAQQALAKTQIFKDDAIPHMGDIVKRIVYVGKGKGHKNSGGNPAAAYAEKFRNCWRKRRGKSGGKISYPKLKELLEIRQDLCTTKDYEYLVRLIELNYYWAEVSEVGRMPMQSVYDLHVPGSHSFIANGFVSHNTFIGI